jgi:hypothetical protein
MLYFPRLLALAISPAEQASLKGDAQPLLEKQHSGLTQVRIGGARRAIRIWRNEVHLLVPQPNQQTSGHRLATCSSSNLG